MSRQRPEPRGPEPRGPEPRGPEPRGSSGGETATNAITALAIAAAILAVAAAATALTGCSDDRVDVADAGAVDGGAQAAPDAAAIVVDPDALVGAFNVTLVAPQPAMGNTPARAGYTALAGRVSDGPTPEQIVWEEQSASAGCRLLTPRVPFCATSCGGSAACVEDDVCQRYPAAVAAGTVRFSGLENAENAAEIAISPVAGNYQAPASVHLAYPPFAEGAEFSLGVASGAAGAFSITSHGIAQLVVTSTRIVLERGQALPLRWTAAGPSGVSRIHVKLDISHHGGTKGKIDCDVDDSGALDIPAPLVTALYDLGVAGYPTVVLERHATVSAPTAVGRVELRAVSEIETAIVLPGLVSCTEDGDCSGGRTCQPDLTCR